MIKGKRILSLALSLVMTGVLLMGAGNPALAADQKMTAVSFQYPNTTSNDWKKLTNHQDMVAACQISTNVLEKMTTDELIETILRYPLLMEIYAYENEQTGFNAVLKNFNGLQELLERNDAGEKLSSKYKKMTVSKDAKTVDTARLFDLAYIEILLRQDEIVNQFTDKQKGDLEKEIENKYIQKKEYPEIYGVTAATSYAVLAQKQGSSAVTTLASGYVYTPNGTSVSVFNNTPELTASEKQSATNWVNTNFPTVVIVSEATRNYNCHSYAWYSQSTSTNTWWMNYPSAYMTDGSYSKRSGAPTSTGDKVYYSTSGNEHSGIVNGMGRTSGTYYVRSKWGQLPLVDHYYTSCPYYVSDSAIQAYYR